MKRFGAKTQTNILKGLAFLKQKQGRILLAREGYPLDVHAIIDACVEHNTIIELNAHPSRLDLWHYGQYARDKGLMISINPDAHSVAGIEDVRYGVPALRKAGFGPESVLNTRSLPSLLAWLESRKFPSV